MAATLSVSGVIQRADGINIVDQFQFAPTSVVNLDTIYSLILAPNGSHALVFDSIVKAKFVVITAPVQITAAITTSQGSGAANKGDCFLMNNAEVTGIVLTNLTSDPVTVRVALGGG